MLTIDEPILEEAFSLLAMLSIEKFSIPHVSGIHIVSGLNLFNFLEHAKTCSIVNNEPRLYDKRILIHLFEINFIYFFWSISFEHVSTSLWESIERHKTFLNFTVFNEFFLANYGKTMPSMLPFVGKILTISAFRW